MHKRVAIVGAGPKAAAIVARAAMLRDQLGEDRAPEILVFDNNGIASAWTGDSLYSNGFVPLCTPGEKDVGFPYDETTAFTPFARPPAPFLFKCFSFSAFLVATGAFANWVDRDRTPPSHALFADYLEWVFDQAEQDVIEREVIRIWRYRDKWCLDFADGDPGSRSVVVDGVVLTGTGEPRQVTIADSVPASKVFTADDFWPARAKFLDAAAREVAVVGDGGAAGTIVAWLAERYQERANRIWSISPMGTLFPRGDGHAERRWFSDPDEWTELTIEHRRKLIERTEAGVVSMRNKRLIDSSQRVTYLAGKLTAIEAYHDQLALSVEYPGRSRPPQVVDLVVNAIGFDGWSRLKLVDVDAARRLTDATSPSLGDDREAAELAIQRDLSLPASVGFPSGLHVPGLAALAQGPGMGNLSCLGLMAARVLQPYVR